MSESIKDTAEIFKALGDETMLKIIKLNASTGNNLCLGMIAHSLGISQPAVSQHLKTLRHAGLINDERRGLHIHYKIVDNFLAPYMIDTGSFLESFGAELDFDNYCEYKGKTDNCDKINKQTT